MTTLKIAIQGIAGSFHEVAARYFFGPEIETKECDTFRILCQSLKDDEVDYCAMAIENTIAGSILPNYALLREFQFKIIGEVFIHIQMNLMALPGVKIEDLKFIHSHPIALNQCAEYLNTLKHAKLVEKNDTAESAKVIQEENLRDTAAVASIAAAEMYGLEILEKRIETNKQNFTRFLILSKTMVDKPENNKASISFELCHQIGALADILLIFRDNNINLTKIQSIPIIGKPYEYQFYVDLEWDGRENYENAVFQMLKKVTNFTVLGEYPKGVFRH
jgi:prephenate dehydratase